MCCGVELKLVPGGLLARTLLRVRPPEWARTPHGVFRAEAHKWAGAGGRGRPQVGAGRSAARAWEGAYGSSPCAIPATVAAIRARFRAWACGVGRLVSDMAISQQLAV